MTSRKIHSRADETSERTIDVSHCSFESQRMPEELSRLSISYRLEDAQDSIIISEWTISHRLNDANQETIVGMSDGECDGEFEIIRRSETEFEIGVRLCVKSSCRIAMLAMSLEFKPTFSWIGNGDMCIDRESGLVTHSCFRLPYRYHSYSMLKSDSKSDVIDITPDPNSKVVSAYVKYHDSGTASLEWTRFEDLSVPVSVNPTSITVFYGILRRGDTSFIVSKGSIGFEKSASKELDDRIERKLTGLLIFCAKIGLFFCVVLSVPFFILEWYVSQSLTARTAYKDHASE